MVTEINPTLHTAALAALESALGKALALDPESASQLIAIEGQVFALHCTAPKADVYVESLGGRLRLMGVYEGEVTTSVTGQASDFAKLASAADPAATLINGSLTLEGDSGALIELQSILASLEIDWEAPLVNALGDVAGHQLAQGLRGALRFSQQAGRSFTRQAEEFIHEEARLSPPRLELEDFYKDIQSLRLRVERLQSRTERLRQRMQRASH